MKATVHICRRAPGKGDLEHDYRAKSKRCAAEREFDGSRVVFVAGDLKGVGIVAKEPGYERGMLDALCGPHVQESGRFLRQVILSGEDLTNATKAQYRAALRRLMRAAKMWVNTYAPGCRWVAIAHQDRIHPHVHLIVENWDYARENRLNLSPFLLEQMQEMKWPNDPKLISGKGSLQQAKAGKALEACDGVTDPTWHQRIELRAWDKFKGDRLVAKTLLNWCKKAKPEKSIDGMVDALELGPLPPGWDLNCRTKGGGRLRRPSVKISGKTLRIDTFLDLWVHRLIKDKSKPDGKEGRGDHE